MSWKAYKQGFKTYLRLERSLSDNSVEAYLDDLDKITSYFSNENHPKKPEQVTLNDLQEFLQWINELGLSATSQARIISGIKAFYKYLLLEDVLDNSPTELLESPKTARKLPDTIDHEEVEAMLEAVDRSKPEGERNRAIVETLYACGLRVSELVNLRISYLFFDEGFIRVIGKGDKERLVPIYPAAINQIKLYRDQVRVHTPPKPGHEDTLFLNRRGAGLSRVMVFNIIKGLAEAAGIQKNISPHTLRHSFATELVKGNADLRAVQEMLGHESITTTEIYTHLDRSFLKSTLDNHPRSATQA